MSYEYAVRVESGGGSLTGAVLDTYGSLETAREDIADYFSSREDLQGVELATYRMERVEDGEDW